MLPQSIRLSASRPGVGRSGSRNLLALTALLRDMRPKGRDRAANEEDSRQVNYAVLSMKLCRFRRDVTETSDRLIRDSFSVGSAVRRGFDVASCTRSASMHIIIVTSVSGSFDGGGMPGRGSSRPTRKLEALKAQGHSIRVRRCDRTRCFARAPFSTPTISCK